MTLGIEDILFASFKGQRIVAEGSGLTILFPLLPGVVCLSLHSQLCSCYTFCYCDFAPMTGKFIIQQILQLTMGQFYEVFFSFFFYHMFLRQFNITFIVIKKMVVRLMQVGHKFMAVSIPDPINRYSTGAFCCLTLQASCRTTWFPSLRAAWWIAR